MLHKGSISTSVSLLFTVLSEMILFIKYGKTEKEESSYIGEKKCW